MSSDSDNVDSFSAPADGQARQSRVMIEMTSASSSAASGKKSPPRKEKPSSSKTPLSVKTDKALKRKLNFSPGGQSEDEGEKRSATPKRRRSLLAGEDSPTPGSTTPKTPGGTQRLTERQQMALLRQMTADEGQPQPGQAGQGPGIGDLSPRPSSPHGSALKRTPFDKRIHKRNERGETSLHVAAIRGDLQETRRLIKAGVDVNVADFAGWTAIHEACNHGWLDVAKQLLKSGANVNVQGLDNDTPLHDAAMNGHRKLVELLVRHGANPLQANTNGKSPLDVAKNEEIGKLLRNEIIASSSSSSSIDEVRSPTSPESNASDHDDSHSPSSLAKKLEKDPSDTVASLMSSCGRFPSLNPSPSGSSAVSSSISPLSLGIPLSSGGSSSHGPGLSPRSSLLHSTPSSNSTSSISPCSSTHNLSSSSSSITPTATTTSSIFKKVHVSHHMDHKSSSPRLTIKFQHIKKKDLSRSVSPKRSRVVGSAVGGSDAQYKSYSVTLGSKSNVYDHPISPTGSSTSQESDLYDPQLEITTYGSKRSSHQVSSSNSTLGPTSRASQALPTESVSTSKDSPDSFHSKPKVPSPQVDSSPSTSAVGGNPSGGPADSHTVSMSQESGPFTPQFEDISDAEDDRHDVQSRSADSAKPPSSILLSSTQAQYNIPSSSSTTTSKHLLSSRGDVTSSSDSRQDQQQGHTREGGSQSSPPTPSSSSIHPMSSNNATGTDGQHMSSPSTSSAPGKPDKWRESPHCTSTSQVAHSSPSWDRTRLDDSKDSPGSQSSYPGKNESKTSPSSAMDVDVVPQRTDFKEQLSPKANSSKQDRPVKFEKEKPHLYPERDNSRSPKPDRPENRWSPKPDRGESRWSPKPYKDNHNKPNLKVDVNRASPKSDRESRDSRDSTDSRHSRDSPKSDKEGKGQGPPKVPPLKIIIPPKSTPTEKEHHHHHHQSYQKVVTSRTQLPYVLNPTQESDQVSTSTVTQSTSTQDPATICQPSHSSSSTVLEPVATFEKELVDSNNGPAVSSSQDLGFRKGRNKSTEKDKSPSDNKPATGDDSQSGCGSDKEGRSQEAEHIEPQEEGSRDSSSSKDSSGKIGRGEEGQVEKRVTRSAFRSQQQKDKDGSGSSNGKDEPSSSKEIRDDKEKEVVITRSGSNGNNSASSSSKHDVSIDETHIHPRKRKLRHRQQEIELPVNTAPPVLPPQHMEKPTNPYELFLDIRNKISTRHKQWFNVQPKAPHGFQDYLMVSCNYVLEGNTAATRRSVPLLTPPTSLIGPMKDLFIRQEKARYRLRLQHVIEREKLMLSIEQEILRVHTRAARALANQSIPLSVCAILRDEDIYNSIDADTEDRDKNIRSRYNGRLFISWLRDVDDKFEKIKESLLLRHHHEAESLYAVQKLEWDWHLNESAQAEPQVEAADNPQHLPMVQVSDDFDLLPA